MKITLIIAMLLTSLTACIAEYNHKFQRGQCVQMRLDGRQGMVTGLYVYKAVLRVRFTGDSSASIAPILGGTVRARTSPYTSIVLREFELESCE